MAATKEITLQILLTELKRQRDYFRQHYPGFVKRKLITPYDRDDRIAINDKLISLVEQAIENKKRGTGAKLMELLNHMPHE